MQQDIPTLVCTGVVTVAVLDAVGAPLRADVVWQCLRVLRDVGGNVILAHAAVRQGIRIAVVVKRGHRRDAGLLETDEWTLSALVRAPCICDGLDGCRRMTMGKLTSVRL